MNYTREQLIDLCEKASVLQKDWCNRDTAGAQRQVGELLALLKAGCEFKILTEGTMCVTDDRTIWIAVYSEGFMFFEIGEELDESTFYLPTQLRMDERGRKDWY